MKIVGEYGNIPLLVADPVADRSDCCDFGEDTCDDLRRPTMLLVA